MIARISLLALLLAASACTAPQDPRPLDQPVEVAIQQPDRADTAVLEPSSGTPATAAPLPAWNEGPSKQAIVDFVQRVTTEDGPDYVPPAERIAVFDNDGTLWCEQPMYVQLRFALDRLQTHPPQGKQMTPALKAMQEDGLKAVAAGGKQVLVELVKATHSGCSPEEFERDVQKWLESSRHPETDRPYTEMVYRPMLELLAYLRAHGFTNYIVSGGGTEFMRPWTEHVYGIPPERVIGSRMALELEQRDGRSTLIQLPKFDALNDEEVKPVGIWQRIGRRPIAAFGNSDGDLQMLQWCTDREGPSFGLLVHHTDAEREWAYDRESQIGGLDQALDQAESRGWTVVDMSQDWNAVFSIEVDDELHTRRSTGDPTGR